MAMPGMPGVPAMAGVTVTPMQGTMGDPFNNGSISGFGWNAAAGGGAGPLIGNLYDNILTINGGASTSPCGPFCTVPNDGAFIDWVNPTAQWGDDLHGIAGPARGGPTAVITSIRYGYSNDVATTTHIIQIYDMIPPSAGHLNNPITGQFGALLASIVIPGQPSSTVGLIVTVTGLSIHAGTAAWIKFGEQGVGFPGTFWLTGGLANGVGTSHSGVLYSLKGPPPYQYFFATPYFYVPGEGYVGPNIQVALSGFVLPAPAAISLLALGGLLTLRRRRSR